MVAAAALASALIYFAGDRIVCPSGFDDAELVRTTNHGKGAGKVVCHAAGGGTADGSFWLGAAIAAGLALWHAWRALIPLPPEPPPVILPEHQARKDKRERRRARKQREHAQRQQK